MFQLREYAKELRSLVTDGVSDGEISSHIQQQMADIYRIVGICLGIPSETFVWEYYDKTKQYHSVGPLTPHEFYIKYVKPYFNVDDKVSACCFAARWFDRGRHVFCSSLLRSRLSAHRPLLHLFI